jgi:L-fuconolactonase
VEILDAQLHCWLTDRPSRPWRAGYREEIKERALNILLQTAVPMPPETLLVEMAAAGVDGGVLTPQGVYGSDNGLELDAALDYPKKFAVVGWVDPAASDLDHVLIRDAGRGMLGVRLLRMDGERLARGDFDASFDATARLGLAIALTLPHPIPQEIARAFEQYPDTQFMIDHVGVGFAPPAHGLPPADAFERLPAVLELARYPNVSLKLTGASALSHEQYPFTDIWPAVRQIVEAFGPDRVMWGSDVTRTGSLATYWQHTHYLREIDGIGEDELTLMYGQNLRRILKWTPDAYLRGTGTAAATTQEG